VLSGMLRDDPDPEVRRTCVYGLEGCGPDAAPALIAALLDRYEPLREDAAAALGKLGPRAVPPLVAALRSPRAWQRQGAARALGSIKSADEAVLSGLTGLLGDPDESVRVAAANGLGGIGSAAAPAKRALASAMAGDSSPQVRSCCALALAEIAPEDTVAELAIRLADADDSVRQMVAVALGRIGPPAKKGNALANLTACLHDRSQGVRVEAAIAIALIDPERRMEMMELLRKEAADPPNLRAYEALERLKATKPLR